MYIGFILTICLFLFIIFLQIKILYKKSIFKKLCVKIDSITVMLYVSGTWFLIILSLAIYNLLTANSDKTLELNAWGDYLAGFFAPLLFGWLVYGVLIQKSEFANALKSFGFQYDEMKAQNEQIEIQQINTWFYRNLTTIQTLKTSIFQTSKGQFNSVAEIAIELEKDITSTDKQYIEEDTKYFNIYDDLKNIFDTFIYIEDHLNKQVIKYEEQSRIRESIKEIKKEFLVLFKNELSNLKKILSVAYFLIALNGRDGYEKYSPYLDWIGEEYDTNDIYNEIISMALNDVDEILLEVLNNYQKINIDFKTWKIRK